MHNNVYLCSLLKCCTHRYGWAILKWCIVIATKDNAIIANINKWSTALSNMCTSMYINVMKTTY